MCCKFTIDITGEWITVIQVFDKSQDYNVIKGNIEQNAGKRLLKSLFLLILYKVLISFGKLRNYKVTYL